MFSLRDHYALPLVIGFKMVLFAVVFEKRWKNTFAILFIFLFAPIFWSKENPFRNLKQAVVHFRARAPERAAVAEIRNHPEWVVCCENQICTTLAEREYLIPLAHCIEGSVHLTAARGRKAVFVVSAGPGSHLKRHPVLSQQFGEFFLPAPIRWATETSHIKVSEPVVIP